MLYPGTKLGKYKVEGLLGRGGDGEVYRAIQSGPLGFSRPVALKIMRRLSRRLLQRFAREARIVARLHHRNIVQVQEFSRKKQVLFLVMELVDGITARDLLDLAGEKLPPWLGIHIGAEVCQGLHHAHSLIGSEGTPLGIVHRDIKPANILIGRHGDVKLSDFGLAKMSMIPSDQMTMAGVIKGTPAYMSPEQKSGRVPVTQASDVFSLAKVVYEMCTGVRLAPCDGPGARPLSSGHPRIPPSLETILLEAMDPQPSRRPSSGQLEQALQQVRREVVPAAMFSRMDEELARWVDRIQDLKRQMAKGADTQVVPRVPGVGSFAPRLEVEATSGSGWHEITLPWPFPPREPGEPGEEAETRAGTSDPETAPPRPEPVRRTLVVVPIILIVAGALAVVLWPRPLLDDGPEVSVQKRVSLPAEGSDARRTVVGHPTSRRDLGGEVGLSVGTAGDGRATLSPRVVAWTRRSKRSPPLLGHGPRRVAADAAEMGTGYISVNTEPWAVVSIDGRRIGTTPLFRYPLPCGSYVMKLAGANGRSTTRQITIRRDAYENLGMILLR